MKRKGGLLLFISACIPGCGQMYQGYMKRGVSLLSAMCAVILLATTLNMGELAIFLPLVWLYAFFDAYNIHGQSDEQAAANPDDFLFGLSGADRDKLLALCRGRHSIIGWALVILGGYALFITAVDYLLHDSSFWLSNLLRYIFPRLVGTALIIAAGVWFIRGPRKPAEAADFTAFTPPAKEDESHGSK